MPCRRRSQLLWSVLLFWSPVHAQRKSLSQHRVLRANRSVKYRRTNAPDGTLISNIWIPPVQDSGRASETSTDTDNGLDEIRFRKLRKESRNGNLGSPELSSATEPRMTMVQWETEHGETLWSIKGDASITTPEKHHRDVKKSLQRRRNKVLDQFVGHGSPTKSLNNSTNNDLTDDDNTGEDSLGEADGWNLTTEVEYGVRGNGTASNATNHTNATSSVVTSGTPTEGNGTHANETNSITYEPIRIRAILSESGGGGQFLDNSQREHLFQRILSPAMLVWSSALRVDPVLGNLTVDPDQLYDGVSCGPGVESGQPSVPVPPLHFSEGIPDTDLIVYLSLGFVEEEEQNTGPGSWRFSGNEGDVWVNTEDELPKDENYRLPIGLPTQKELSQAQVERNETLNSNCTTLNETSCEEPSSLGEKPKCTGSYVASATYCSTDQYDRPTAALLHLCIDQDFFEEDALHRNIITVMHELGHALGFNSQSMAHFRYPDGSPITPRTDGDVVDSTITCTGPLETRGEASVPLPSEEILQFRNVRGVRVAELVTPSVKQVIRNHFNCQELPGAELESGEYLEAEEGEDEDASSCIGNHWERRLMRTDLMNPLLDEVPFSFRISPLTLALFADSGWYQVDLSRAKFSSGWGRAAGCTFVEDQCLTSNGEVASSNEQYFCNKLVSSRLQGTLDELHGCSPDLSRKAACSISQYSTNIPQEYQYFDWSLGSDYGGTEPFLDYCPVYTGFANGQCTSKDNQMLLRVDSIEKFGAKNSRCLFGTMGSQSRALCLPIACVMQDKSLMIKTGALWQRCQYAGQRLTVSAARSNDQVICPDPRRICPTFYCRRDCLGNGGLCDYVSGECLCNITTLSGSEIGACDNVYSDDQVAHQLFYDDVAETNSSLADIYYESPDKLNEDGDRNGSVVVLVVVLLSASIAGIGVCWLCWIRRFVFQGAARALYATLTKSFRTQRPASSESDLGEKAHANKDIMIATMLVDMRIHHPQLELDSSDDADVLKDTVSESAASATETESSGRSTKLSETEVIDCSLDEEALEVSLERVTPQPEVKQEAVAIGIKRRRRRK